MKAVPRKHHYLPQFYLKHFSRGGDGLFQVEKATAKIIGGRIKDLGALRDFHELDFDGVADKWRLEKNLAEVEGQFSGFLSDLLAGSRSVGKSRDWLPAFVSLMQFRVPAVRSFVDKFLQSNVREVMHSMEKRGRLHTPPPRLAELLDFDSLEIEISNWKCMELMFQMAADPSRLRLLEGMRLRLYGAPFGAAFYTSDQPVSMFVPRPTATGEGVGPLSVGVEIGLPLSSRCYLLLDRSAGADQYLPATTEMVDEFNRRTTVSADRFIFAGETPGYMTEIVRTNASRRAGLQIKTHRAKRGSAINAWFAPVLPDRFYATEK